MKKKFKFTLQAISDSGKPTVQEFKEGMGPAVLATMEAEFDLPKEKFESFMFEAELRRMSNEFRDECVDVKVEEIE